MFGTSTILYLDSSGALTTAVWLSSSSPVGFPSDVHPEAVTIWGLIAYYIWSINPCHLWEEGLKTLSSFCPELFTF